ncbi:MAG: transcriptional regulator [Bacteroidales bacterium]|nr:transcriptional regulator [Bacteroidales bacterium]
MEKYLNKYKIILNSTPERILVYLKMHGPQTAALLAKEFKITTEGARLHLKKLIDSDLVSSEKQSNGVGRPMVYYSISEKGTDLFPNTHGDLTVQLINSVKTILGQKALDKLIDAREQAAMERYEKALKGVNFIEEKLEILARIRSEEGYMAEWKKEDGDYLLIENHCPICAAAKQCQGFCKAELHTFQKALGNNVRVERLDHIVQGARRCCYKIKNMKS